MTATELCPAQGPRAAEREWRAARMRWVALGKAIGTVCLFQGCRARPSRPGIGSGHRGVSLPAPGYCGTHAIDEIAIQRAIHGDQVHLWPHERVEAVRRLAAKAFSDSRIAELLHIATRSVTRIRSEHDIPSTVQTTILKAGPLA